MFNFTGHRFYLDQSRLTTAIRNHLGNDIETEDYDKVFVDLDRFSREGMKIWVSPMSSYAIYNAVTIKVSPSLCNMFISSFKSISLCSYRTT